MTRTRSSGKAVRRLELLRAISHARRLGNHASAAQMATKLEALDAMYGYTRTSRGAGRVLQRGDRWGRPNNAAELDRRIAERKARSEGGER